MAKRDKVKQPEQKEMKPQSAAKSLEMTLEQAKAYRASLHKPVPKPLTEAQRREAFRIYWAGNKKKYGSSKYLEHALWLHLKTIGMDAPENFEKGIFNFGFKKV